MYTKTKYLQQHQLFPNSFPSQAQIQHREGSLETPTIRKGHQRHRKKQKKIDKRGNITFFQRTPTTRIHFSALETFSELFHFRQPFPFPYNRQISIHQAIQTNRSK